MNHVMEAVGDWKAEPLKGWKKAKPRILLILNKGVPWTDGIAYTDYGRRLL